MEEVWDSPGKAGGLDPRFLRLFNDWDVGLMGCFIEAIPRKQVTPLGEDRGCRKENKNCLFSVNSL